MTTSASTKRSWKLSEFVAHGSKVNCVAMGHKSGRVMVTGGEDKKVNMWAIGKTDCIMSLAGHTSPVESVRFNGSEVMVAAGSLSGALKVWDLEAAKIVRTLMGHKASIKSLEFHPHGDFVTSGSLDSTIKLWDMRRKGCIFTYKGHNGCINCVRFSPDGRWIASGGEDGLVRIWDLTAGKALADFKDHSGSINSVEFHPRELFLASGSADRTVRFFDLESMQCVSVTDPECTPIRSMQFHPELDCLYSSIQDSFKVYGWEPARCLDSVSTVWSNVVDMSLPDGDTELIGASFSKNCVILSMIDVKLVQPIGGPAYESSPGNTIASPAMPAIPRRRSFIVDNPPHPNQRAPAQSNTGPHVSRLRAEVPEKDRGTRLASDRTGREVTKPVPPATNPALNFSYLDFQNLDYEQVFHPTHELPRGQPSYTMLPSSNTTSNAISAGTQQASALFSRYPGSAPSTPTARARNSSGGSGSPVRSAVNNSELPSSSAPDLEAGNKSKRLTNQKPVAQRTNGAKPTKAVVDAMTAARQKLASIANPNDTIFLPTKEVTTSERKDTVVNSSYSLGQNASSALHRYALDHLGTREREVPDILTVSEVKSSVNNIDNVRQSFQTLSVGKSVEESYVGEKSELDILRSLTSNHSTIMSVISGRQRTLQIISSQWISGNIRGAIDSSLNARDPTVFQHVISQMTSKESLWTLDMSALLLPPIYDLVTSKYDSFVLVGLNAVKIILRNFAQLIRDTVGFAPSIGVDISHEERYSKCSTCYKSLMDIREEIDRKSVGLKSINQSSSIAQQYREVMLLLNQLD